MSAHSTEREDTVDLREDAARRPVQCSDREPADNQVAPVEAGDFIDLRQDVFPVQCTEPSEPNSAFSDTFLTLVARPGANPVPVVCSARHSTGVSNRQPTTVIRRCYSSPSTLYRHHNAAGNPSANSRWQAWHSGKRPSLTMVVNRQCALYNILIHLTPLIIACIAGQKKSADCEILQEADH